MSVAGEISRLTSAKASIKTAIEGKGVTVPSSTTLDGYAALIASIPSGGGDPELPSGYTRKSYIYGAGNAYIDTGISGAADWSLVAQSDADQAGRIFIGQGNANSKYFAYLSNGHLGLATTNTTTYSADAVVDAKHNITILFGLTRTAASISGDVCYRSGTVTRTDHYLLFSGLTTGGHIAAKLWSADAWQGGALVFHGIPCLNSSNVAGLYDTVSGTFFKSETSTNFTAG